MPTARPVRRFVAAALALAAVLAVVWWTGAVSPRLSTHQTVGGWDAMTRQGTFTLEVTNDAPLAVDVRLVRVEDADGDEVGGPIDGEELVTVAGGSIAEIDGRFERDCPRFASFGEPLPADPIVSAVLEVRLVIGLTRTERAWIRC